VPLFEISDFEESSDALELTSSMNVEEAKKKKERKSEFIPLYNNNNK